MGSYEAVIQLSAEEREQLTWWSKSRTLPAGDVFRASADFEKDAAEADRWQHALVVPQDGDGGRREPSDRSPDLGEGAIEATPTGSLHGQQRSGVRGKSG